MEEIKREEISADREDYDLGGIVPVGLHCQRLKKAHNTFIWSGAEYELPEVFHRALIPDAIVKRVQINTYGLNGLATHIFSPRTRPSLDGLRAIMAVSNEVNGNLGLPPANDLFIRTRRPRPVKETMQKYVSLALLVTNVSGTPSFRILGHGKVDSLQHFYQMLPEGSYLIIHDDNPQLQRAAIHGTYLDLRDPPIVELIVGTDMLHARALSEELGRDQKTVVSHLLHLKGYGEGIFHHPAEYKRGSADALYWIAQGLRDEITGTYGKVQHYFGPNVTMEFRYYRHRASKRFHVLDVMQQM